MKFVASLIPGFVCEILTKSESATRIRKLRALGCTSYRTHSRVDGTVAVEYPGRFQAEAAHNYAGAARHRMVAGLKGE